MAQPRAGIAGFLHESNTFLSRTTPFEDFEATSLTRGTALVERWQGAAHELGGMLAGCHANGLEAAPLYATFAVPSGPIKAAAYERITAGILDALRESLPLDGLLIALHGATVAANAPDADGELLSRIRALVGPEFPIVMTFDLHANLSARMIAHSNAAIGYRSNPHLDQRERGMEASALLARLLRGQCRPVQHLEAPPMLIQNSRQHTLELPAKVLYDDLEEVRRWPGILTASVAMGFAHADVEEMGASFLAVSDGDPALAARASRWMAARAWERRHEFTGALPAPAEAVRRAAEAPRTPVVLLDTGDNAGGGSAADGTILLAELLAQRVPDGLVILHDPDAVARCREAGPGARVTLEAGGKTDRLHGDPVTITGTVRLLHDGRFEEKQVRHGGWTHNDQGLTAVLETTERHTVVLTSRRMAPFSLEQILSLGIRPERKRVLIVKGVVAPRAAYEPVAAEFILVGTPGATADDPRLLPYKNRRLPLFPLEDGASYY